MLKGCIKGFMNAYGEARKTSRQGLYLGVAMLFCSVCASASEQSASPQQDSNQLFQELRKMEQQPPQGKEHTVQPPAIASHYPPDQYLLGTGQGDLSKGRLVCRRVSELAASVQLAALARHWATEHAVEGARQRARATARQDSEGVREEAASALTATSRTASITGSVVAPVRSRTRSTACSFTQT